VPQVAAAAAAYAESGEVINPGGDGAAPPTPSASGAAVAMRRKGGKGSAAKAKASQVPGAATAEPSRGVAWSRGRVTAASPSRLDSDGSDGGGAMDGTAVGDGRSLVPGGSGGGPGGGGPGGSVGLGVVTVVLVPVFLVLLGWLMGGIVIEFASRDQASHITH
jgi:hypothetical protein